MHVTNIYTIKPPGVLCSTYKTSSHPSIFKIYNAQAWHRLIHGEILDYSKNLSLLLTCLTHRSICGLSGLPLWDGGRADAATGSY